MDWMSDMTARWIRILSAHDGGRTPLDEAVDQVAAISGPATVKKSRFKRDAGSPAAATAASRQLIAGVLVSDLMLDRLVALAGQTREQVLEQLSAEVPAHLATEQLTVLRAELSGGLPASPGASYSGLGSRVEQLLKLAEQQAAELIESARAEAAQITASAGPPRPCPRCGYADRAEGH